MLRARDSWSWTVPGGYMLSIVFLCLLHSVGLTQEQSASSWKVEDLAAGVKQRESAVRRFYVRSVFREKSAHTRVIFDTTAAPQFANLHHIVEGTWEPGAMLRYRYGMARQMALRLDSSDPVITVHYLEAGCDGTEARSIEGAHRRVLDLESAPERRDEGRIYAPGSAPPPPIDPMTFTTHLDQTPISFYLTQYGGTARVSAQTYAGRRVVVVEIPSMPVADDFPCERVFRITIDSDRGFIVLRKTALKKRTQDSSFLETSFVESSDWQEVEPGIWMPNKVRRDIFQILGSGDPALLQSIEVENEGWQVNQDVADDVVFRLKWHTGEVRLAVSREMSP